jgi:hypothetical protein
MKIMMKIRRRKIYQKLVIVLVEGSPLENYIRLLKSILIKKIINIIKKVIVRMIVDMKVNGMANNFS